MLYIVGGAARSGKTLLAQRLQQVARIPWFSLDMLRAGLTKGEPGLDLAFDHDDLQEAERLWPIVREMLDAILLHDVDYLVEGSCLRPFDVAGFMAVRSDKSIRSVFLGCPDIAPGAKRAQIDRNRVGGNDWFSSLPDAKKFGQAERIVRDSRRLREQCAAADVDFVDTGHDFQAQLAAARALLMRPRDPSVTPVARSESVAAPARTGRGRAGPFAVAAAAPMKTAAPGR